MPLLFKVREASRSKEQELTEAYAVMVGPP